MIRLSRLPMDELRERTIRAIRRAGWPGAVGLGLIAFSLAFSYSAAELQDKREAELVTERTKLMKVAASPVGGSNTNRARLTAFYDRFAMASELSNVLADIHLAAQRRGLLPERADYRSAVVTGTPLVRINATLPIEGRFDALYAWLGEVMRDHPGVVIDQMSLKRESAQASTLSADVRLSVLVRGGE
ncbi:hypothetical protein [Nitrogeniibacter aestuarii]|uniref:hypothetical protein n=1 Tax=Nitrogeniibacter aestuarii TaxID=2815343 RepID=UPI001E57F0FC|nr:hypothetical protein [Nitrogeniibacter aestuarii]